MSVLDLATRLRAGEPSWLLDVREPWEHALVALPNSTLVPLDELTDRRDTLRPPRGALVVVYCHHGVRSLAGAAMLDAIGMQDVVSLRGGIDAWARAIEPGMTRY